MPIERLELSMPDGILPVSVAGPDDGGSGPGVVLVMDAGGVRPTLESMAQTIADRGYVVAVPELYYRHGAYRPFELPTAFLEATERERLLGMARSVRRDEAVRDVGAVLELLASRPDVTRGPMGITGYCMGGGIALSAAGAYPDRIAAAASFHGGRLATDDDDSPHLRLGSARARIHVAVARDDASFPAEMEQRFTQAVRDAGVNVVIEHYDAAHGFAVPDLPSYDATAAARHDEVLTELFGTALQGS